MQRDDLSGAVQWRTVLVAAAIYSSWFVVTAFHAVLPWPLLVLVGGWLLAWHGSLQHETIHGHPTRNRSINDAIGSVPLSLWLPYRLYRRSHRAHHAAEVITDPQHDPESRYRSETGGLGAVFGRLQSTLLGQMVFGPPILILRFLAGEGRGAIHQPALVVRDWLPHLAAVIAVLWWLDHVGLSVIRYGVTFVYPGMALTMLRSYAEHRADLGSPGRAASVEQGGLLALLFLNNNLHAAHHERPALAWYDLPAYHRIHRARFAAHGAPIYRGYGEIVRRFAFHPHDDMIHPSHRIPLS